MSRSINLTKRLKDISDKINPPEISKQYIIHHTEDGYVSYDLKINSPVKKQVINQALKKVAKNRTLYIVVLDIRQMNDEKVA